MLLRNRLLGGIGHGALFAAAGESGSAAANADAAPAPDAAPAASPQSTPSADAASPPGAAASPDTAAASASAAAGSPSAEAAPVVAAPAKPDSAGSLLADASAKAPGEADGAKAPDAKPDAKVAAKPDAKVEETPAPAKPEAKADAKADAKPDGAAPAPAEKALAETPPARTYETFKVPDGLKLDDARVKDFTTILDNGELSHQDRGQKLMDMFVEEATRLAASRDQHQRDVFDQLQNGWKEELRTDAQVGGNRLETSLGRAKWVVEQFGGDEKQVGDLLAQLSYTGMGNNVGLVRMLDNLAEILSEGEIVPASPHLPKDTRPRSEKWYGKNGATG